MSPTTAAWLALACPLAGTIVNALGFRLWRGRIPGLIGTVALAASFVFTVIACVQLQGNDAHHRQLVSVLYDYAVTGTIDARVSILIDPLSILMMLVVTGVSTLIHLYSYAYMSGDRGYTRFFSYLNFFVFSMLVLVMAANFFLLIVGWAFVGAASYLLISFWYRRETATKAGIKAFVINVVGDIGLTLGTFFILKHSGTLDFLGTFEQAKEIGATAHGDLTAGLILLLVGAFAKSAQIPLHTWLPDAMEGPTPVS
ncbi:MAG TPA: proton-conducting transporter membrane subunit, partial [Baekduia sp.]|uniref:proton-conducting transporter transmembrane domain-containing protein n=1 Tax=Baekduia sp. TaxID=2600305 RepID=UPI002C8B21D2